MDTTKSTLPFDLETFDECIGAAVEAAQVGFYFEEGGCWGMAEALFTRFQSEGLSPRLVYRPHGFVHAWVMLGDLNLDWRGVFQAAPGAVLLDGVSALREAAAEFGGTSGEDYLSDVALADSVLQNAFSRLRN